MRPTWLRRERRPTEPAQCHTLAEFGREVTASAVCIVRSGGCAAGAPPSPAAASFLVNRGGCGLCAD
ncbi:hypothetical protein EVAR_92200_1 [Eumeta japonica]|uniref:Uncharacterized protein n=1 Tax=Eumeta variegata TaxID=151549 RepID=A0A4C1TL11_EUMVA|nr:hypothetical protein EVAR_92200_1 [Eumeta japonica]